MASMRDELDRAIRRDLAELDAAHVAARVAWEAARTYEEAAFQTFAAASTRYILAIAAQERGGDPRDAAARAGAGSAAYLNADGTDFEPFGGES